MFKTKSLRLRIFLSMIFLVLIAFAAISSVMIFQYRKQSEQYHKDRLFDKENQIRSQIQYVLTQTTYPVETSYIPLIFREDIYQIANIQNLNFDLYDLNGKLLKSSKAVLDNSKDDTLTINKEILKKTSSAIDKRYVEQKEFGGRGYQSSYSYVNDPQFKPIAILSIPYFENDTFVEKSLRRSLYNLLMVYFTMLILALVLAYFMSRYITKSLKTIEKRLEKTRLLERNEKIYLESPSAEIGQLVSAYNSMIDELENSKHLLAKSEREQAWREMAKQVAHEIKNPLTPMRLSVQSFERKFDPNATDTQEKLHEFSESLIQQIDILSNISSAFSAFTNMPQQHEERFDLVPVVKRTIDIFDDKNIHFKTSADEIQGFFDRDQLVRVVTNLIKNALQATERRENPEVKVLLEASSAIIKLTVSDNGVGIPRKDWERIFEPKFTTKSSGSGLGLAIVKNIVHSYGGTVGLTSTVGEGSTFCVTIPKNG